MSGVINSLTLVPEDNQLEITSRDNGDYVITNSIPLYTGVTVEGINRVDVTPVNSDVNVWGFAASYSNLNTAGITLADQSGLSKTVTNDAQGNDIYVLSANVKSLGLTNGSGATSGLTITQAPSPALPGNLLIETNIKGFSGPLTVPGGSQYGIAFSGPDSAGIVTATPTVCGITPGVGIGISNGSQAGISTIRATVADIVNGTGIVASSNPVTGVYQLNATVGDVTPGNGIFITNSPGGVKQVNCNFSQPTLSGIEAGLNSTGGFEIDATYANLTTSFGLSIDRDAGDTDTPPSANLVANVSSLAATGIGITTSQNTGTNEWTINNTGVLSVVGGQNISVNTANGVATVTYDPSTTFGDELILSSSLQVPTIIGGRTTGTYFNTFLLPQNVTGSLKITSVQPALTLYPPGATQNWFTFSVVDTAAPLTPSTTNSAYYSIQGPTGSINTPLFQENGLDGEVQTLGTQQISDLVTFLYVYTYVYSYYNSGTGTFYKAAALRTLIPGPSGAGVVRFNYQIGTNLPLAATGVAFNGISTTSIVTTDGFGIYFGLPFSTWNYGNLTIPLQPIVVTGTYGNPIFTRQFNKGQDDLGGPGGNIANAMRSRCFCTQEGGGLVEIPFYLEAPYFGTPINIPNSPVGAGWLPLTIVPLDDQWAILPAPVPTAKFNYLVYLSNGVTTSVYNTLTQGWQSFAVNGYVSSFSDSSIISIAPVNGDQTIYSQFYGGQLVKADISQINGGGFPTYTARALPLSLFKPTGLNPTEVNMFVTSDPGRTTILQSTLTPDSSEYVGNNIEIKASDVLSLVTTDCQINTGSLEITNLGMSVASGVVDFLTDSVSIDTGSLDLQTGTSLNLGTGTTMTAVGATVDLTNASLEIQPKVVQRYYSPVGTPPPAPFLIKVPIVQSWNVNFNDPTLVGVLLPGVWSVIPVYPPKVLDNTSLGTLTVTLAGNPNSQAPQSPPFLPITSTIVYNVMYNASTTSLMYVSILWTPGLGLGGIQNPSLMFTLTQNTQ